MVGFGLWIRQPDSLYSFLPAKLKESPDVFFMEPPTTNGTDATTLNIPVTNGHSKMSQDNDSDYIPSVNSIPEKTAGDETSKNKLKGCLGENLLTVATLIGVLAGIGLGFGLKSAREWSKREVMYVSFPGELFLNMLKCLILPLIISSLVQAVGSLDTKLTGKIGFRAVAYYMLTTLSAIILGIILVVSIRPGAGGSVSIQDAVEQRPALIEDTLMDLVRNMFPPNILQACLNQYSTILIKPGNMTNDTENLREWDWEGKMVGQTNILGVVVAAVVLGITLGKMGKKGKPLLDLFSSLGEAIMIITRCVIWLSPLGVLFLVASKIMEMEDLALIAGQVGMYSVTVLAGILIHGFIVLPLIYFILTRKNPLTFMIRMGQALATAFGTASSSATLPITLQCLEDKNHIDPRVTRFCVPIGATINMDGTALYEAVAAIFVAQVRGISLNVGNIVAISITATAASIGAAGIPQAGLVTMVMVLNVIGLPAEDVALILVVDWILDRFRTTINVLGDAYGSGIVAHLSQKDLEEISLDELNMEMTTL